MKGLFQCPRGTEGVEKTIEGRFSKKLFELFLESEKPTPFYEQQSRHYN